MKKTAKASSSKVLKKPKPIRRARQTGIRDRILSLLSTGPMRPGELQEKGDFTTSGLQLHIKKLKASGDVVSHKQGRTVTLSLKGKHKSAENNASIPIEAEIVSEAPTPKRLTSTAMASTALSPELHEALNAVVHRLDPLQGAEEKRIVLEQLAQTIPPSIAKVLQTIIQDLVRFSSVDG